ncbi:hypothetical protein CGI00_23300 [Vibrio parahaemolyticus]|nr:hypothetical protein CGJ34_24040 [Vibrio parahaemolyticus]TOL27935.1 hypothetical protein CGI00_23300 [Vibrio parahaemolyticus]TOL45492.1 hypothetical protein CGH97_23260 [Vibrio parahaemolyticus]
MVNPKSKLIYAMNLCLNSCSIHYCLSYAHNKRFKTDSQRVAFVVCGKFSDLGGVRKHRIALLTT